MNRSIAQVHALLFLAEAPLDAEEIANTLAIARSNVSTSLKELLSWRLIRLVHLRGDRRDRYQAENDLWAMLRMIVEGRKAREIDPTLSTVRECALEAEQDGETPAEARKRIGETMVFLEELDGFYRQVAPLPDSSLRQMLKAGSSLLNLLPRRSGPDADEHG